MVASSIFGFFSSCCVVLPNPKKDRRWWDFDSFVTVLLLLLLRLFLVALFIILCINDIFTNRLNKGKKKSSKLIIKKLKWLLLIYQTQYQWSELQTRYSGHSCQLNSWFYHKMSHHITFEYFIFFSVNSSKLYKEKKSCLVRNRCTVGHPDMFK